MDKNSPLKWTSIARLKFSITCVEGLRVGGSGGGLEIGGVDANLSVLRNPVTGEPYLPGSSLKGKLRSVLEKKLGKTFGDPCGCGQLACLVCKVFGAHMKPGAATSPTRIVVRDAPLSVASKKQFAESVAAGTPVFEEKTENIVDRKTGTAKHPRTGERVPPDTVFDAEILLHIFEGDKRQEFVDFVRQGLAIIQEGSSLGASGSRGYGKVRFKITEDINLPLDGLTL